MAQTPEKRESKPFVPPPWELEQFEELRRRKAEAAAASEAEGAAPGPAEEAAETPAKAEPASPTPMVPPQPGGAPAAETPAMREASAEGMLRQLEAEEPKLHEAVWKYNAVAATVLGVFGVAMLVYGAIGVPKASAAGIPTAWIGVMAVLALGTLMTAGGLWVGMRSIRHKRGEL
jgi:hypothetical protein